MTNRNWVVPGLSALAVLAVLVFVWLPSQVDTQALQAEAEASTPVKAKKTVGEISPWSDAQLAKQRKAAQEILGILLDEQFALEELRVELWAAEDFTAAQALATLGDEQYRQQQFLEAGESYQAGLDAMETISSRVDDVFQTQLQLGLSSLASDQAEAAITALELAVILRPELPEPQVALARAQKLEPLLALLDQAREAQKAKDLDSAHSLLLQARELDQQHEGAQAQLNSVVRDIARRNFNRAMTAGYQALGDARYDVAEREFLKARKILPGASETDSALQQTRTARTQAQIEAFAQRAEAAESREDWNKAIAAYREILDIDGSVIFARSGMIQAQTRAKLEKNLNSALAKPERLSDDAIYQNTRALYRQASALEKQGPILRKQLQQLDELLRLAVIPIEVLLRSDEETDVTVYRVAHLGTFKRQQLSLKPGTYTAVGVRSGFRDVRKQFTVSHQADSAIVEISCTEPI